MSDDHHHHHGEDGHAGHRHIETATLTRNQALVMGELDRAEGPLSAYTILDQLRDKGLRAPLQVYRALDKLVEFGMVHRLESLNAFVACRHPACETNETTAFIICETCGQVREIADTRLAGDLEALAAKEGFRVRRTTIELRGLCKACGTA